MSLPPEFLGRLALIEEALRRALAEGPDELVRMSRYVLGWEDADGRPSAGGGKRLRPLLCLEVAAAAGADPAQALPGAVAVELVHNFSLVHDDIQDGDALRHGRPTAWQVVGAPQAINLGNFLYTRGLRQLADSRLPGAPRALAILFEAVERMVAGQWADIAFEDAESVTEEDYLAMVEGKTGALLGAAAGIGAALAGAPRGTVDAFRAWGERLGLAFQVQDDYLGAWGDAAATGKSTSSDIARRKKTLPVVFALASDGSGDALRALYRAAPAPEDDTAKVLELLETSGAREHTRALARRFSAEAEALLADIAIADDARDRLRTFARFIAERDR